MCAKVLAKKRNVTMKLVREKKGNNATAKMTL
jgi:hypothetical protein